MADKANTYDFEIAGKKYSVPSFTNLPIGAIRKARKAADEADMAFTILEIVIGENSAELAALDTLNSSEFAEWMKGWTQGAGVGEASSSES